MVSRVEGGKRMKWADNQSCPLHWKNVAETGDWQGQPEGMVGVTCENSASPLSMCEDIELWDNSGDGQGAWEEKRPK